METLLTSFTGFAFALQTPLMHAAAANNAAAIRVLCAAKADPNCVNDINKVLSAQIQTKSTVVLAQTPLIIACERAAIEAVRALVICKADIHRVINGQTALTAASRAGACVSSISIDRSIRACLSARDESADSQQGERVSNREHERRTTSRR